MRLRERLVPLFFAILSLLLCVHAEQRGTYHRTQAPLGEERLSAESWGARPQEDGSSASPAFTEAWELLQKMQPPSPPWYDFQKGSGVFSTGAYYAKELFFLLFMNGPPQPELLTANPQPQKLSPPLARSVDLLEEAAAAHDADAIFTLAEMNFYGNFTHPRNYSEAFRRYHELATLNGNASAQHMVGFMYATGFGGAVKQDQAKAMLYHTLAAEGGDVRSEMTIGYRHSAGIATRRNCEEAVYYYRRAAEKAMAYVRSGPPGGHSMPRDSYRIADDEGGVYGEGASASSSGANANTGSVTSDAYSSLEDVKEYMHLQARKGDPRASFNLAKLSYDGARDSPRDLPAARKGFLELARMAWTKEGKIRPNVGPLTEKLASKAAGYLGRMYLRGEGVKQDFNKARIWFRLGVSNGDALSQYSLGLMYLHGLGLKQDAVKAADYFGAAADQDLPVAQVRLGALFLDQGDVATAIKYFEIAARHQHLEAYYYLAELTNNGVGQTRNCAVAAAYYKIVVEKAEIVSTAFTEANQAYAKGDLEAALVAYMMAAEQGFEVGQANVAYLLDQAAPRRSLSSLIPFVRQKAALASDAFLALIYWTRSAEQKNVDSMVKLGDYYLSGLGTTSDAEKAAACYQAAAETRISAQAQWNLGWMHENGVGVDQDFHLAKRHYDLALDINPREAYLPVVLALYKLRARSWWNTVTHGSIKSIQEEPVEKRSWSLTEWINAFLDAELAAYDDGYLDDDAYNDPMPGGDENFYGDEDYDSDILEGVLITTLVAALATLVWFRARVQAQFQARGDAGAAAGAAGNGNGNGGGAWFGWPEGDRERVARILREHQERQQQGQQRQGQGQGQAQGQNQEGEQQNNGGNVGDGQQGQQQHDQEERGVFPARDDPNFMDWVAGGVGH